MESIRYSITIKLVEGEESYIFLLTLLKKLNLNAEVKRENNTVYLKAVPEELALRLIEMLDKYSTLFKYEIKREGAITTEEEAEVVGKGIYGNFTKIFLFIAVIFAGLFLLHKISYKPKPKQKIIFCVSYYSARGYSTIVCNKLCAKYACNINLYLKSGWRIVSSSRKEIIEVPFDVWNGCKCVGTEYVLEKR